MPHAAFKNPCTKMLAKLSPVTFTGYYAVNHGSLAIPLILIRDQPIMLI